MRRLSSVRSATSAATLLTKEWKASSSSIECSLCSQEERGILWILTQDANRRAKGGRRDAQDGRVDDDEESGRLRSQLAERWLRRSLLRLRSCCRGHDVWLMRIWSEQLALLPGTLDIDCQSALSTSSAWDGPQASNQLDPGEVTEWSITHPSHPAILTITISQCLRSSTPSLGHARRPLSAYASTKGHCKRRSESSTGRGQSSSSRRRSSSRRFARMQRMDRW